MKRIFRNFRRARKDVDNNKSNNNNNNNKKILRPEATISLTTSSNENNNSSSSSNSSNQNSDSHNSLYSLGEEHHNKNSSKNTSNDVDNKNAMTVETALPSSSEEHCSDSNSNDSSSGDEFPGGALESTIEEQLEDLEYEDPDARHTNAHSNAHSNAPHYAADVYEGGEDSQLSMDMNMNMNQTPTTSFDQQHFEQLIQVEQVVVEGGFDDLNRLNGTYTKIGTHKKWPKFKHIGNSSTIFCGPGLQRGTWAWKIHLLNRTDAYVFTSRSFKDPQQAERVLLGDDTNDSKKKWSHVYIPGCIINVRRKQERINADERKKATRSARETILTDARRQSVQATFSSDHITDYCLNVLKSVSPKLKIAVVGGGIYGCHNALTLAHAGFDVTLLEKEDRLFAGASGHCAFRIHRGYHYPRSQKTRSLCEVDHMKFLSKYQHLVNHQETDKVFLISQDGKSNIDLGTMEHVMKGAGLPMDPIDHEELGFDNVEGGFIGSDEPLLYADYPREWFGAELAKAGVTIKYGQKVENVQPSDTATCVQAPTVPRMNLLGEEFDFCINCTYNQSFAARLQDYEFWYEVCAFPVAVLKEGQEPMSFGVFDGPFPSIEPYHFKGNLPERFAEYQGRQLYQIWHVKNIVWKRFQQADDAWAMVKGGIPDQEYWDSQSFLETMDAVRKFYPKFDEKYEIVGFNTAIKTMVSSSSSSRPLVVVNDVDIHPFFFTVFSAKLSTVFSCAEAVFLGMVKSVVREGPRGEAILDDITEGRPSMAKMTSLKSLGNDSEHCTRRPSIVLASAENDMFSIFQHGGRASFSPATVGREKVPRSRASMAEYSSGESPRTSLTEGLGKIVSPKRHSSFPHAQVMDTIPDFPGLQISK